MKKVQKINFSLIKKKIIKSVKDNPVYSLFITLFLLIRVFIIDWSPVPTGSMSPNIIEGDYVLMSKIDIGFRFPFANSFLFKYNQQKKGEVISIEHEGTLFVKRVMAVGGDIVNLKNNEFYVNGVKLARKEISLETLEKEQLTISTEDNFKAYQETNNGISYNILISQNLDEYQKLILVTRFPNPITIPENHFYMIGDNRNNSKDSRYIGLIHKDDLRSKMITTLF